MKKSRAFNLIELMVVIAIIGVIAAISTISYTPLKNKLEISGFTKELTASFRQAQENAVTEQLRYEIRFDTQFNPRYYSLIKINEDNSENILWTKDAPSSIYIEIVKPDQKIMFSPDGSTLENQIYLLNPNGILQKEININPIGTVSEK